MRNKYCLIFIFSFGLFLNAQPIKKPPKPKGYGTYEYYDKIRSEDGNPCCKEVKFKVGKPVIVILDILHPNSYHNKKKKYEYLDIVNVEINELKKNFPMLENNILGVAEHSKFKFGKHQLDYSDLTKEYKNILVYWSGKNNEEPKVVTSYNYVFSEPLAKILNVEIPLASYEKEKLKLRKELRDKMVFEVSKQSKIISDAFVKQLIFEEYYFPRINLINPNFEGVKKVSIINNFGSFELVIDFKENGLPKSLESTIRDYRSYKSNFVYENGVLKEIRTKDLGTKKEYIKKFYYKNDELISVNKKDNIILSGSIFSMENNYLKEKKYRLSKTDRDYFIKTNDTNVEKRIEIKDENIWTYNDCYSYFFNTCYPLVVRDKGNNLIKVIEKGYEYGSDWNYEVTRHDNSTVFQSKKTLYRNSRIEYIFNERGLPKIINSYNKDYTREHQKVIEFIYEYY